MAAYNKFQQFVQDLCNGAHNFSSHTFKVMLTNTQPNTSANKVKTDITEIPSGNGYSAGGTATTISSTTESGGTEKPLASNVAFTASGGTVGPFRYAVLYNSTQTSPASPLVSFWDYGSSITLNSGDSIAINFDQTNGLFQLS